MSGTAPRLRHHARERLSASAHALAGVAGSAWTSGISTVAVIGLLVTGLVAGFPIWWQTVVYSAGALVSLMVLFSIQHTTNRQTQAILLKLDELLQATHADDSVIAVENRDLHEQEHLHERHRRRRISARSGTDTVAD